jgi:hypothetical protein
LLLSWKKNCLKIRRGRHKKTFLFNFSLSQHFFHDFDSINQNQNINLDLFHLLNVCDMCFEQIILNKTFPVSVAKHQRNRWFFFSLSRMLVCVCLSTDRWTTTMGYFLLSKKAEEEKKLGPLSFPIEMSISLLIDCNWANPVKLVHAK